MRFKPTAIDGAYTIELEAFRDNRGAFSRQFCTREFEQIGFTGPIAQINHSATTQKGTVRGLHYQLPPACETKIIRCLQGKIFDVMVDLRAGSPTFMKWHGIELSKASLSMVFIPEGVAHGFQTLTDHVEMIYLHSAHYTPHCERGIRFDDERLSIKWPEQVTCISSRDLGFPGLEKTFNGLTL